MSSARARISLAFSDATDYYPPKHVSTAEYELTTPTKRLEHEGISAATGGTSFELGTMTTITFCYVANLDTTNYVTVTGQSNSVAFSIQLPAAPSSTQPSFTFIPSVTPGADLTLTADTSACLCDVVVFGT